MAATCVRATCWPRALSLVPMPARKVACLRKRTARSPSVCPVERYGPGWRTAIGLRCALIRRRRDCPESGPDYAAVPFQVQSMSEGDGLLSASVPLSRPPGDEMAEELKIESDRHCEMHSALRSTADFASTRAVANRKALLALMAGLRAEEDAIQLGGGAKAAEAQHGKGRLTARERLNLLLDERTEFLELGLWAAQGMYAEYGGAPGAGVVTGLGKVSGRLCMIVANDATVKAGAFFPMTAKKVLRAQTIAMENRIPAIYLVDSSGVFLPLQEDVFPDTDDFGRIFRNNAVMSSQGIPQITAIMGMCVAGGAYLPVMTDTVLMTEGSGLFLAG